MDKLREIGCRSQFVKRHTACESSPHQGPDPSQGDGVEKRSRRIGMRQNTAPDGQVLPDWLTWFSYETTVGEQVVQTGEILQLPLTYYGPSIPLGPYWTYGGLTSPAPGEDVVPSTDPGVLSPTAVEPTETSTFIESTANEPWPTTLSGTTIDSLSLQTAPGPASPLGQTIPALTSTDPSIPSASAIIDDLSTRSASTSVPVSSSPSTTSQSDSAPTTSGSQSFSADSNNDLVPLLPAILVPVVAALLLILALINCFRRRERSQQGYTTALGASSGGYGGWLTSSFAKRANGSSERFTSAWTALPDERSKSNGAGKGGKSTVSAAAWAKSEERSAWLGFIPHHHRTSSSVDHGARPLQGTNAQAGGEKEEEDKPKQEEELEVLADRSQSLLGRLNLGLGWLSVASLTSSRGSRVASGHTLERGNGGPGALGRPARNSGESRTVNSSEKTGPTKTNSGSNGNTGSGSGARETTSGSAGLSNDQLFFRAPLETASSHHSISASSRGSPVKTGFFSRLKTASTSFSKRSSRSAPSRRSWVSSQIVVEGEEDEALTAASKDTTPEGISVAVPITPSTLGEGDKAKGATKWASRERLRFPMPPKSSGGASGEKESLISSHTTEYHSAESNYSLPSGPPTEDLNHPAPAAFANTRKSFDKNHNDYAQPALSPFGSKESFQPAHTPKVVAGKSMRDLFSVSPGTTRPSMDSGSGGGDSAGHRRSYVGQPIIDDTLLHAISTGQPRNDWRYAGLGGIDEFGQTIRTVSGDVSATVPSQITELGSRTLIAVQPPTIFDTTRRSQSQQSEIASFHSTPSTNSSASCGQQRDSGIQVGDADVPITRHALGEEGVNSSSLRQRSPGWAASIKT